MGSASQTFLISSRHFLDEMPWGLVLGDIDDLDDGIPVDLVFVQPA
jgi:hypothetical protein